MPDLSFGVESAGPLPGAIGFRLRVSDAGRTPVHSIALRCQVRILPARRRYSEAEQARLLPLFGTPDRWGKTLRDLPWAVMNMAVPAFTGTTVVDLPVPCDRDPTAAATRYFDALDDGDAPLLFLFSGTVSYEAAGVGPQVGFIPWDREARFRLPAAVWKDVFSGAAS
jgi:hypothetical protein